MSNSQKETPKNPSNSTQKFPPKDDIFNIEELPDEVLLHLFAFLDIISWKNARLVSDQWNQFLCRVALTSNYAFVLRPKMSVSPTKSFFPIVKIPYNFSWEREDEFLEILEIIGKQTIKLSIDWNEEKLKELNPPKNMLTKFPELQTIKCSVKLLFDDQIPSTVNEFSFLEVKNFMSSAEIAKIEKLFEQKTTKVTIEYVEIVSCPKDSDIEFIKIDEIILKIAKDSEAKQIKVKKMNLREKRSVELEDIKEFLDLNRSFHNRWCIGMMSNTLFLENLENMPNLERIKTYAFTDDEDDFEPCFMPHILLPHSGIQHFELESLSCKVCLEYVFKSFPNLKTLKGDYIHVDFGLIPHYNPHIEIIYIWDVEVEFKLSLELQQSTFLKLKKLSLYNIHHDVKWNKLVNVWPKMPNLKELTLTTDSNPWVWIPTDIKDLFTMFRLCPNVEFFCFENLKKLRYVDLIEILKMWPKLKVLSLLVKVVAKEKACHNSKKLIDAIAPYAKNLQVLDIMVTNPVPPEGFTESNPMFFYYLPDENHREYAKKKIPTIHKFSKFYYLYPFLEK